MAVLPPYQEALARLSGPVEKVLDDTETPGCRVVPALLFTAKTDIVCLIAGILVEPGRFGEGAVLLTSALTSCALDGPATGLIPDRVFETCLSINPAGVTTRSRLTSHYSSRRRSRCITNTKNAFTGNDFCRGS